MYTEGCTPSRFWYVGRHGGRLTDDVNIERIYNLAEGPVMMIKKCENQRTET